MNREIHNLLKIENDETTIFTNKELKMIDDYINELEIIQRLSKIQNDYINELDQKNQELKDNWNKIEQIIENERMSHWTPSPLFLTELLSKMEELEKSNSNE